MNGDDARCVHCGYPRDSPNHRTAVYPNAHEFDSPAPPCEHNFAVVVEAFAEAMPLWIQDGENVVLDQEHPACRTRATKLACTRGCGTLLPVKFDG